MELCKEYKTLNSSVEKDVLCESFELDFQENLPQYLDDIERIVKCSVKSVVTDYECTGGAIKLYGKSIISITYFNSSNCLLSNIFEEDFSKPISAGAGDDIEFAQITLTTKYSNFRLINQRRIDVHTSLKAKITLFSQSGEKCLANCKNAFVREYNPMMLVEKSSGICSEEFDENFTVSSADSQIRNIVNTFANCIVEEKKIIKDKMLVKLRMEISVLYESESSSIEKSVHNLSLSKIIDVSNAGEEDKAFVSAEVSGLYVKAKANSNNQLCDIEAVGKVTFNYKLCSMCQEDYIIDSYMPKYEADIERGNVRIKSNPIFYYDDKSCEIAFQTEKNVIEILDLKAEIIDCTIEESKMILSVKLAFLYYDDSSQLCYFEKTEEYSMTLNDNKMNGNASAVIISYDYLIKNANTVSLKLNFEYSAYLFSVENVSFIADINASAEKNTDCLPQLTLYFAQKNEDVWDIAKKFSTAVSLIMEENDLKSEVLDCQKVLLVPGM